MKAILNKLLAFCVLTISAQANWLPYIGAGIGASKSQNNFIGNFRNTIIADSKHLNMSSLGGTESFFLGVRKQNTNYFVAGELFAQIHQMKKIKKNNSYYPNIVGLPPIALAILDFEIDQYYTDGISFLIGKDLFSNVEIFLKGDIFWSKFSIKYTNSKNPSITGQQSKWLFGGAPGFGVQAKLAKNFSARFDYSYRIYQRLTTNNISQETFIRSTVITGNVSPRVHQIMLSLIYTL